MLRQVAREAHQFPRQQHEAPEHRVCRIEAGFGEALGQDPAAVPPRERPRHALHLFLRQAERLAQVAYRAARPVTDHCGRERGTLPPVFRVEVLDHLLAPLVLEIDVDVGRLVPLLRDEALEQRRHACRIHLGNAERVAHRGIRRRAAPLAQDALRASKTHHVVHGKEKGFVAQLGDQPQLVLDQRPHLRRHSAGEALDETFRRELRQPAGRGLALRHQLLGILVAQLVEGERAALCDCQGFRQQLRRVELRQAHARAQVPLGVRVQRPPAALERRAEPDRGERVLQPPARAQVHVHIARGDQGQPAGPRQLAQRVEPGTVVRTAVQLGGNPGPPREMRGEPVPVSRHQQRQQPARSAGLDVGARERVAAFLPAPAPRCDQGGKHAVGTPVRRQQRELRAVLEPQLGADDQLELVLPGSDVRTHHARERALVGERERRVAERRRAPHQLLGMRGAAQEGKVRQAVQLGVVRQTGHAGTSLPWRGRSMRANQPACAR